MTFLAQDHIVLIVADIEVAISQWQDRLGMPLSYRIDHDDHGIRQAFFSLADNTFIELIAPTDENSRVAKLLEEKGGEGLHLLALQVEDLDAAVQGFDERGVTLIGKGTDGVFIHPDSASGVMIQLWPKDRPHRWRSDT